MATNKYNISDVSFPTYSDYTPLWRQMRITNEGEHRVKNANLLFLPMTEGQAIDYDKGNGKKKDRALERYGSYKLRAIYPSYVSDTIIAMLGIMYSEKPKKIELPSALEQMKMIATPYGDSLEMLMRRTNENQLIVGRRGLMLDPPAEGDVPKILEYSAEAILNWEVTTDEGSNAVLNFILLDESGYVRDGMKWEYKDKFRLLALDGAGFYYTIQFEDPTALDSVDLQNPPESDSVVYPEMKGERLKQIPFVFINATSTLPDIEKPPLLALSDSCVAIYRGDADYRLHLYQQAQDTLFLKGFDEKELEAIRMGAGAYLGTTSEGADAKYIGVNSQGLPEERQSQTNLHQNAIGMGLGLLDNNQAESGEALQTRLAVKTASMQTIALSGARGIEMLLRIASKWIGADPAEVIIEPNTDFSSSSVVAKDILDLWTAKLQGLIISEKSIHEYIRKNDYTELDYDEEVQQIEEEGPVGSATIPEA